MKALLDRGWRVSASNQENVPQSAKEALAWALRTDIKEFGEAFVVDWLATAQEDAQSRQWVSVPPEGLVLQVSRVRNVAAPKIKEDAASVPKLHKISLTDGHNLCHAIEKRRIESLSSKIPPGTKVRLQPGQRIQYKSGFLLLEPAHVDVLGGKVEDLVEKWAISQELAHFTRAKPAGAGGPPPWVAFGKRIGEGSADAGFKALPKGETDKDGVVKESVEFESQRKDAIEEAAKQGGKKVFGGGTKEVKDGDRRQHNNRYAQKAPDGEEETHGTRGRGRGGRGGRGRRGGNYDGEDDESGFASSRPSTGVSLFSFLEKELPESAKGHVDREPKSNRQGGHTQGGTNRTNYRDQSSQLEFQGGNSARRNRGGGHSGRDDGSHGDANNRNGNHRDGNPRDGRNGNQRDGNQRDGNQRDGNQRGRNKRGRGRDSRESHAPSRQSEVAPRHERQGRGGGNRSTYDRDPMSSQPYSGHSSESQGNPNERAKRGGKRGRGGSRQPQDDRDFGEWENSTYTNAKSHPPPPHHGRDRAPPSYAMNDLTEMMHVATMNHQQPPPPLIPPPGHPPVDPKATSFGTPPMSAHGEANRGPRVGGRGQSHSTARPTGGRTWKEGDLCLAKYWEDGQFYLSQVTAVGQNTVVVLFPDYGNHEEVLLQDLKSVPGSSQHRSGRGGGFSGRGRYPNPVHPTIAATPGLPPAFPST